MNLERDLPTSGAADAARVFSVYTDPTETQSTVILGAGIIGCATAYYLSHSENTRPDTIHLVEASPELFASASGKSGGFLAPDWFGPPSASLGELSFTLHKELADRHNGYEKWGYSRSTSTSLREGSQRSGPKGEGLSVSGESRIEAISTDDFRGDYTGPAWLARRSGDQVEKIGEEGGVAQVDPLRLSRFLLRESLSRGVRLHQPARAVKVSHDESGDMSAVRIQHGAGADLKIPCTRLLIAAGAWTPSVFKTLFPESKLNIPVSHFAGYSLVVRSPRWTKEYESNGFHAIFTSMRNGISPEIFSRTGDEIYVAGLNDPSLRLPDLPTDAQIDEAKIDKLKAVSQQLLGQDGKDVSDLQIVREGLCFRPITQKGVPILCRLPDGELGGMETKPGVDGGVFVAAGHGPWGISLSLGTGKVMAEMMERQQPSADIGRLGMQ